MDEGAGWRAPRLPIGRIQLHNPIAQQAADSRQLPPRSIEPPATQRRRRRRRAAARRAACRRRLGPLPRFDRSVERNLVS